MLLVFIGAETHMKISGILLGLFLFFEIAWAQNYPQYRYQYDYQQQQKMQQEQFNHQLKKQEQILKSNQEKRALDQEQNYQKIKQFDSERRHLREKRELESQGRALTPEEKIKQERELD